MLAICSLLELDRIEWDESVRIRARTWIMTRLKLQQRASTLVHLPDSYHEFTTRSEGIFKLTIVKVTCIHLVVKNQCILVPSCGNIFG